MQMTTAQYPGINNEAEYSEELLVGYRWYNAKGITPLYPFGYGLAYTQFSYSNLDIYNFSGDLMVTLQVKNIGQRFGTTVPQLYVTYPLEAGEPPRQLRDFQSVDLDPYKSAGVTFRLRERDFSIWNVTSHSAVVFPGTFTIEVGFSSRDIALTGTVVIG